MKDSIKELKGEWLLTLLVMTAFYFIRINVDVEIGSVYTSIIQLAIGLVVAFILLDKVPKNSIHLINNEKNYVKTAGYTMGAFALFVIASQVILTTLSLVPTQFSQSVFDILQATTPVLSNVSHIQFVTFSFLIPYIETFTFFVLLLDLMLLIFNQFSPSQQNIREPNMWIIATIISVIFVLFHFNAKIVRGNPELLPPALVVSFVFAMLSVMLVVHRKQWMEALLLHVGINGWTMYQLLYA